MHKIVNGKAPCNVTFSTLGGTLVTKRLIQDTGATAAFILDDKDISFLKLLDVKPANDKVYGILNGASVMVKIDELTKSSKSYKDFIAYYNESLIVLAKSEGYDGIAGLPFLKEVGYGGDGEDCWIGKD